MRKILSIIRITFRQILFPEGALCLNCGKISKGSCLCPACRWDLENGEVMDSWEWRDLDGVKAWSIRPHRGVARQLVLSLKYRAEACAAKELGSLLRFRPAVFPVLPAKTKVTWVPMPPKRRQERCIDHGRLLAEIVARELGLEYRELIMRRKSGHLQARLNRKGREKNLRDTFAPAEKNNSPVLLVDDVLTTGTTALRCIEALREGGAKDITVLTMTWADN